MAYDMQQAEELIYATATKFAQTKKRKYVKKEDICKAIAQVIPAFVSENPPDNDVLMTTYVALINLIKDTVNDVELDISGKYDSKIYRIENLLNEATKKASSIEHATDSLNKSIERLEKLKRLPSSVVASSLSPATWYCSVCGAKMGKICVDGRNWTNDVPNYCPNCGAPTSPIDQEPPHEI